MYCAIVNDAPIRKLAPLPFGKLRQGCQRRCFQLLNFAGIFQQHGAGRGKRDVSATAIEELHSKVLLQSFDLQGDGRLGQAEFLRRSAEVQVFGHSPKNFKPEILHAGNLTRVKGLCLRCFRSGRRTAHVTEACNVHECRLLCQRGSLSNVVCASLLAHALLGDTDRQNGACRFQNDAKSWAGSEVSGEV